MMHPPPMRRMIEGVTLRREAGVVNISGTDIMAVRRVVRGQKAAGETWVRVGREAGRRMRRKQEGPMAGAVGGMRRRLENGRRKDWGDRVTEMTRARKGVRIRMDAGTVERMRWQLATRDVDRERAGVAEERFGDG